MSVMACVNADGTLTTLGRRMLAAIAARSLAPDDVARLADVPLYRVRSSLRELAEAGVVVEEGGRYGLTAQGRQRIAT